MITKLKETLRMRKLIFFLSLLLMVTVLGGCQRSSERFDVSIIPDRETYMTTLSSVQGITLSPQISSALSEKEIVYEWIASDGSFIKIMTDHLINDGDSVLWNPIKIDSSIAVGITTITLNVRDKQTNIILAKNTLKIKFENQQYRVIK